MAYCVHYGDIWRIVADEWKALSVDLDTNCLHYIFLATSFAFTTLKEVSFPTMPPPVPPSLAPLLLPGERDGRHLRPREAGYQGRGGQVITPVGGGRTGEGKGELTLVTRWSGGLVGGREGGPLHESESESEAPLFGGGSCDWSQVIPYGSPLLEDWQQSEMN